MHRRAFLGTAALAAGGTALPRAAPGVPHEVSQKRILVLGGTNYVGPHLVRAALDQGHEVTLFNRGFTNPDFFPHVEHLRGNRFGDRGAGLTALRGARTWDVVLDTWHREPGCVRDTARLLAERTERYLYISSIAVLGTYRDAGLDESAPTVEAAHAVASFDPELSYPVRKRAAELAVLDAFGDRATVLRCSTVHGLDYSRSDLSYWALRFLSGEPFLVPDDRTAVLQWTDVRDVGRFALHAVAHDLSGVFHLINPAEPVPLWEFFSAWHMATGARSRMIAAPRTFLSEHNVRPWTDLPLYIPEDDPEPGFFRIDVQRVHATGFPFRPLGETIADVRRTFAQPPAPAVAPGGLDRQRELALIWMLTRNQSAP